jgi:hypothetical protein
MRSAQRAAGIVASLAFFSYGAAAGLSFNRPRIRRAPPHAAPH